VFPESRHHEVQAFIARGLTDFSISRTQARARGWGIPVPSDPAQVMYVWFDALTNYITALGYGIDSARFRRYWISNPHRVHIIGKDILRFHAVYWPALLLSAGLPVPTRIIVHGFLTREGRRMSKTLGTGIDPAYSSHHGVSTQSATGYCARFRPLTTPTTRTRALPAPTPPIWRTTSGTSCSELRA
jgi:methionyl-tRNA synthetase